MIKEPKVSRTTGVSRRQFLGQSAAAGTGLVVAISAPWSINAAAQTARPAEVNAWVVVRPDDSVVIRIARSEMGQGTLTGLAQLVAEELECDWAKVTTEYPTPGQSLARNRVWGNFSTGGSRGIRDSQDYMRKGGAIARTMLVQAAANEWQVAAADCRAANSVITHVPSGRTTTYGKLAAAAGKLAQPASVTLKNPADWKLAGKRLARLDTVDKTTGAQMYGIDLKLPGMLNAAIKDCPVFGGKLKSFDAAAIAGRKGVKKVVRVNDSAVAVVADTWWHAKTALDALPIEWDEGPHAKASSEAFAEVLKAALVAPEAAVGNENGDARKAIAGAARKIEAVYGMPHQNHATMEPMNATVKFSVSASGTPELCEVWTPTQNGEAALAAASEASGLPASKCEVYKLMLGGGFGRRGGTDLAPQSIKDGKDPVVFQGLLAAGAEGHLGYSVPNLLIDYAMRNPHVPAGFWRGVNLNQNSIYVECFIDELAHATGQDPLAFRHKLLVKHPLHRAVLDAAAQGAGWGKPAAKGVFRGLAQTMGFGSYVAACAEVSVSDDGELKIHRIVAATDPGHAVNPQQIEAQIEGSFAYGLSAALFGECTVKDGRMEQDNFHTYPVVKMADMPRVESIVMPSGGFWGGVGEPTIAVAAPAVLNAIFAATGKRIRELPLKNHSLKKA
ncbi:MAG: molybdopterin-dependent oxidoreductase [Burkholderiales bacterium]|nr:molybdopterin-dependent oxidoreductase [Burkholderiales bacterium]